MSLLNNLFNNPLTMPIPLTLMGLVGIPYMAVKLATGAPSGGSGELGFIIPGLLVLAASLVAGVVTIPAVLLGAPWFFVFPVAYYLSVLGIMGSLSR